MCSLVCQVEWVGIRQILIQGPKDTYLISGGATGVSQRSAKCQRYIAETEQHIEGTFSSVGMIPIKGPDCQQVMDSEFVYS